MLKFNIAGLTVIFLMLISLRLIGQGPPLSYFYDPATDLPNAYCYVSAGDQVRQKVAFFPVINEKTNAPMGTESYRKDIDFKGDLIFIGDDITNIICDDVERTHTGNNIWMMYEVINDSLDYDEVLPLSEKISMAINKGASAVVVVSANDAAPLYILNMDREIPVISMNPATAKRIFRMAGADQLAVGKELTGQKSKEFTDRGITLQLNIDGRFNSMESDNFTYYYQENYISEKAIDHQKQVNEKALAFLFDLFDELNPGWSGESIYYYPDYKSKIFYTAYWGRAFSCEAGVYHVFPEDDVSFAQAVHENTHSLFRKNGWEFVSFIDEGLGMYAEANATDKEVNNRKTYKAFQQGRLYPLGEMLKTTIGKEKEYTNIAYPASGSFIDFVIDEYGMESIPALSKKSLQEVFKTDINTIEQKWISWLTDNNEAMKQ